MVFSMITCSSASQARMVSRAGCALAAVAIRGVVDSVEFTRNRTCSSRAAGLTSPVTTGAAEGIVRHRAGDVTVEATPPCHCHPSTPHAGLANWKHFMKSRISMSIGSLRLP